MIFKHAFPEGSVVSVSKNSEGEVVVGVSSPRPDPVWLKKFERKVKLLAGEKVPGNLKFSDSDLDTLMFNLIANNPGYSKSYYTQLNKDKGGFGGSQERKDKAIMRLMLQGRVVRHALESPVGRRDHELWPAR
jgi:hypothetical protein